MVLQDLGRQRFVFVGGKGGVGKTTVSASLALGLAKRGERVLIISTDPAHNLSDVLRTPVGKEIGAVAGCDNLWAVEIDPAKGLERFLRDRVSQTQDHQQQQRQQQGQDEQQQQQQQQPRRPQGGLNAQMGEVFEDIREWLSSLPGIDEAVSLMQLFETEKSLENRFDKLVVDTAPTGHTLKMLQLPRVLEIGIARLDSWKAKLSNYIAMASIFLGGGGSGPSNGPAQRPAGERMAESLRELKSGILELRGLLQDAERCTFVCVGIAESLSVLETARLVKSLGEAAVDSHVMIVNKLLTDLFSEAGDDHQQQQQQQNQTSIVHGDGKEATDKDDELEHRAKSRRLEHSADAKTGTSPAALALALCQSRARIQQKYLDALLRAHGQTHRIYGVQELAFEPTGPENLAAFLDSAVCRQQGSPSASTTAAPGAGNGPN